MLVEPIKFKTLLARLFAGILVKEYNNYSKPVINMFLIKY